MTTKHKWVCKLPDGRYVGNLISGLKSKSFVPVELKWACCFISAEAAKEMASEHGAKEFEVLDMAETSDKIGV